MAALKAAYPWVKLPLVVSAPMLGASTPLLAANVNRAGGMGFLAGGTAAEALDKTFGQVKSLLESPDRAVSGRAGTLPVGVGFQLFNCSIEPLAKVIGKYNPAAVWLFAPKKTEDFRLWSKSIRAATGGKTQIWIQVASVAEASDALSFANPDVLVLQGADAGGHGQTRSAGIISLVPEVVDMLKHVGRSEIPVLAAGGVVEARGFAAALALGAAGAVMGTRFLASEESGIAAGWRKELVRCSDGGISTTRSTLCDRLKGTKGWPSWYDGRMILNKGHADEAAGMPESENVKLYNQELQLGDDAWGPQGRMVTYAGTGVGLIRQVESASNIVNQVLMGTNDVIWRTAKSLDSVKDKARL